LYRRVVIGRLRLDVHVIVQVAAASQPPTIHKAHVMHSRAIAGPPHRH
jgi:hypothetical protein